MKFAVSATIILSQPKNQEMDNYGDEVILSVQADTHCGEIKYDWLKDGQVIDPELYPYCREVNSPDLMISPFMPEYEGRYKCRVSSEVNCVESNIANLSKFTIASQYFYDLTVKILCNVFVAGVKLQDKCFLCHKVVDNEGGTVEGAGIKLQIPKDAIPPGETCAITVHASVCGPSVQSNIHLVTPVFHIKCVPERQFNKEIELTIEHFTNLETQGDVDDLVYMVIKKGEDFHPSGSVTAQVGSSYGTVHVTHFCKTAYGTSKGTYILIIVLVIHA